jgi:hypothetical protein
MALRGASQKMIRSVQSAAANSSITGSQRWWPHPEPQSFVTTFRMPRVIPTSHGPSLNRPQRRQFGPASHRSVAHDRCIHIANAKIANAHIHMSAVLVLYPNGPRTPHHLGEMATARPMPVPTPGASAVSALDFYQMGGLFLCLRKKESEIKCPH